MKKILLLLVLTSLSLHIVPGSPITVGTPQTKWQKTKKALTSKGAFIVYGVVGLAMMGTIGTQLYYAYAGQLEDARRLYNERLKSHDRIDQHYFDDENAEFDIVHKRNDNGFDHSFAWPQSSDYTQPQLNNLYNDILLYNKYAPRGIIKFKPYFSERGKIYKLCLTLPK